MSSCSVFIYHFREGKKKNVFMCENEAKCYDVKHQTKILFLFFLFCFLLYLASFAVRLLSFLLLNRRRANFRYGLKQPNNKVSHFVIVSNVQCKWKYPHHLLVWNQIGTNCWFHFIQWIAKFTWKIQVWAHEIENIKANTDYLIWITNYFWNRMLGVKNLNQIIENLQLWHGYGAISQRFHSHRNKKTEIRYPLSKLYSCCECVTIRLILQNVKMTLSRIGFTHSTLNVQLRSFQNEDLDKLISRNIKNPYDCYFHFIFSIKMKLYWVVHRQHYQ